jgi:DNA mismatch repair protein MutS
VGNSYPPLIQGFIDVQSKYPGSVVMTEVGGFFEIWQLDELGIGHAERASQILDIVLTRRDKSKSDSPKMAGFPSYAVDAYVKKLVAAGETVVIVRQEITGKKSDNNKNVRRFVERIVSPATCIDESQDAKTNYFASCYLDDNNVGVALIDLSTGYVSVSEMTLDNARNYLEAVSPVEILFNSEPFLKGSPSQTLHLNQNPISRQSSAGVILSNVYEIENPTSNHSVTLTQLGLAMWPLASLSIANLLNFLTDYNPRLLKKLSPPRAFGFDKTLFLSKNALLSLDIFESPLQSDTAKTLYGALNRCKTAMGRRVLRRWLEQPLTDMIEIEKRLDKTEKLLTEGTFFERLTSVYDLSRLLRRFALNNIEPHELPGFYHSLKVSRDCLTEWHALSKVDAAIALLESGIDFEALEIAGNEFYRAFRGQLRLSLKPTESAWARAKASLDIETERISKLLDTTKLRTNDRQESVVLTGPKGLQEKCKSHGVKFKLKASEIQITDETWEVMALEELNSRITLSSVARSSWVQLQETFTSEFGSLLLEFSEAVGELDVLSTFARIARERNYTRPTFLESETTTANFSRMRHPVLELSKDTFESFVPNDIEMKEKPILVIYGANSAGKSTVLKGLALNVIMAQIGCFVAASSAELTIFSSIMTRMTTFDSLSEGLSTFTMEMIELQNALKKMNERSLLLFDEIGRGTSVEDGEAIAYAVLEHLNSNSANALTLFATHYHSLYEHIVGFDKLSVKHFDCEVVGSNVVFSRELKVGPGNGSYGLAVAKTCGVPESIIRVGQNYKKRFSKLVVSRYNSKLQGTVCEWCRQQEAQETHHLQEQLQGKVHTIEISGVAQSIHNEQNLVLLCGSCHRKVTTEKLTLRKRRILGAENYLIEIDES